MVETPRVSIGVPLYRSAPFVDNIASTLQAIDYPNLEFVIADQHGLDDAAAELRRRFDGDARARVFVTRDRLPWTENYNFVLRASTGRYFRWLAHDDWLPPTGLEAPVAALEGDPDAVLAYGPVSFVDTAGAVDSVGGRDPGPMRAGTSPGALGSWLVLAGLQAGGAFTGLIRRDTVVEHDLFIRPTLDRVLPERAWLFGLSLLGRFLYVPEYVYGRRRNPSGLVAGWRVSPRHHASQVRVALSYVEDHARLGGDGGHGLNVLSLTLAVAARVLLRTVAKVVPPRVRAPLRGLRFALLRAVGRVHP